MIAPLSPRTLITAALVLAPLVSFAENNNDPGRDINSTSLGTRMNDATRDGRPVPPPPGAGPLRRGPGETMNPPAPPAPRAEAPRWHSDAVAPSMADSPENRRAATVDAHGSPMTAQDQSQSTTDLELTRAIRRDLMGTSLSMKAKNVAIVTKSGRVWLKGEVATNEERQKIDQIARTHAGATNVNDEMTIAR